MAKINKQVIEKYLIYLVLLVIVVVFTVLEPKFISFDNIINLLRQVSVIGLLAMGVALVIISKGIDLSSGSVVAVSAVVGASLAQKPDAPNKFFENIPQLNLLLIVAICILVGIFIGLVNGLLIAYTGIPAFIATLGTMVVFRAFAMLYTGGQPISFLRPDYEFLGKGYLFTILPIPVVIFLVITFITWVLVNYTTFGKGIYAIGGNIHASTVSGIKVNKILALDYMYAGALAALGGVLLSARVGGGQPSFGTGYELDAIAAATIGGVSHSGGIGTVGGVLAGVIILGVINNGLNLLGVQAEWQSVAKGAIIVISVIIDTKKYNKNQ